MSAATRLRRGPPESRKTRSPESAFSAFRRLRRLGCLAAVLACALAPALASAQAPDASPFGHSPIRYHLDDSNLTLATYWYKVRARQAFSLWSEDLEGKLAYDARFERVDDPAQADIVVWFRNARTVGETCGNATRALGCANFSVPGKVLIEVKTQREDGAYYSYGVMGAVLRHEIGHALGLPHSPDPDDVMYAAIDTTSYADAQPVNNVGAALGGIAFLVALIAVLVVVIVRQMRKPDEEEPEGPARP